MATLSNTAKEKIGEIFSITAKAHGGVVGEQFSVEASRAQKMEERIATDASWFYRMIQVMPVVEKTGDVILMSASGLIGGRTNTDDDVLERKPRSLFSLIKNTYDLLETEWDTFLRYTDINAWALQPTFRGIYGRVVRKAIARSRIVCGWYGTSRAVTSDIAANPLLQDVNKGWLKRIREYFLVVDGNNAPLFTADTTQYKVGTVQTPIEIGSTDYPNLDVLVLEAKQLLPAQFRDRADLVAMVSSDLIANAEGKIYSANGDDPRKKVAGDQLIARTIKSYGGLQTLMPPDFPEGTILITFLGNEMLNGEGSNLQIYYQIDAVRRQQIDNPRKNRIEEFLCGNEDYAVGEYEACALIEGITIAETL